MTILTKIIITIAIFIITILISPAFLIYSDRPEKVEIAVLFNGNPYYYREMEAKKQANLSSKKKLIIPFKGTIIDSNALKKDIKLLDAISKEHSNIIKKKDDPEKYRFYETTHIEILNTKIMLDYLNIKSAVIVSYPYHMRRIKIMTDSVFDKSKYTIILLPSKFEPGTKLLWFLNRKDIKWVISEYKKIGWFLLYSPFVKK